MKPIALISLSLLSIACVQPTTNNLPAAGDDSTGMEDATVGASSGGNPSDTESSSATTVNDDTAGNDDTDLPPQTCPPETNACISKVPDGWNGPVARIDGTHPSGCHSGFDTPTMQAFVDVVAPDAECSCTCADPLGGECEDTLIIETYPQYISQNETTCYTMFDEIELTAGESEPVLEPYDNADLRIIAPIPTMATAGECEASSDAPGLPDPQLSGLLQICEPSAALEECDADTVCVPKLADPFEAGVCIWMEGEQRCPAGTDFGTRGVRRIGVVDTRSCSACSCGTATGEACDDATISLARDGNLPVVLPADGECQSGYLGSSDAWTGLTYDPGDPSGGSCASGGGEPLGEVAAETTITFCGT